MKSIHVGNLSLETTEDSLRTAFSKYGEIRSIKIITDRDTGESRGFGFVEMSGDGETDKAIEALNGSELDGKSLTVSEARPKKYSTPSRPSGGGRRGYR